MQGPHSRCITYHAATQEAAAHVQADGIENRADEQYYYDETIESLSSIAPEFGPHLIGFVPVARLSVFQLPSSFILKIMAQCKLEWRVLSRART